MKRKTIFAIAGFLFVAVMLAACGEQDSANEGGPSRGNGPTIGAIVPLTGPAGDLGQKAANGLKLADSLLGVRVVIEDSKGSSREGLNAFRNILTETEKLTGVVSFTSNVGNAIIPVAEDESVVTVHVASAPDMTEGKEYAFRWYITSDDQMSYLADYLAEQNLLSQKIGFVYTNDDYGIGSLSAFKKHFESAGGDPESIWSESYDPSQKNFRSMIAEAKNAGIEVLSLVGYSENIGTLLNQAEALNFNPTLVGDDAISYPNNLSVAGAEANGFVFAGLPLPPKNNTGTSVDTFFTAYKARYDEPPGDFATFAYSIVKMLKQCQAPEGNQSATEVADCLESEEFNTILGRITFNSTHSGNVPLVYKRIEDGQVVRLATSQSQAKADSL